MINILNNKNRSGYIVLMSVLLIGAIAIAVTTSMLVFGVSSSNMIVSMEASYKARAGINACAEDLLEQIKNDPRISGNGYIDMTGYGYGMICAYDIGDSFLDASKNIRITLVTDPVTVVKKMVIHIYIDSVTSKINIASWKEVNKFIYEI